MNLPLVFIITLISKLYIRILGNVYFSELILLAIFFVCIVLSKKSFKDRFFFLKEQKIFLILCFFWLLGQVITDAWRQNDIENSLKGAALISFFIIDFIGLSILINSSKKRIIYALLGLGLSNYLVFFIQPNEYMINVPWKFGIGTGTILTLLSILLIFNPEKKIRCNNNTLGILILACLSAISFLMNSRSMGGVLFLSSLILLISKNNFISTYIKSIHGIKLVATLLFVFPIIYISTISVYSHVAASGYLGEEAKLKYYQQSGDYGVLLGGRTELIVSTQAVIDSPFIGHGSWVEDPKYKSLMLRLSDLGYDINEQAILDSESDLIPTHSFLMGAWVWAGLLGAIFWLYTIQLYIKNISKLAFGNHCFKPIYLYIFLIAIWNILFSPFGSVVRLSFALSMVLLFDFIKDEKSQ